MTENNYSLEIQRLLIQSMLTSPEMFTRCQNILKPSYFDKELTGTVKFILGFSEQYNALPSADQIEANTGVKIEKIPEFGEQHQKYYLEEIEGFCRHKAIVAAVYESADLISKGNPSGIESIIKDAMLISLHKSLGIDYFEDPLGRLMRLKEQNGTISTGWSSVDRKLYNVGRGEILLFLANSGGGKSVALQNITLNLALQGLNVIYVTLELKEELCAKRIDSMSCDIAAADIYKRLDDVVMKVTGLAKRSGDITIKEFPASTTCARDLRSYLKEYEIQKGFKPDALVVDYVDLMVANDKRVNPADLFIKDKFISEEMRNLAKEFQLLCVTASQLNRSAIDTIEYDMSMVAGGKSKIDTADNVIAIRSGPTLRDRGEIQFEFLKTRNSGGVGSKISLAFDIETLRIVDLDQADSDSASKPKSTNSILNQIKTRNNTADIVAKVQGEIDAEKEDLDDVPWVEDKDIEAAVNKVQTVVKEPTKEVTNVEHTQNLRNLINKTRKK